MVLSKAKGDFIPVFEFSPDNRYTTYELSMGNPTPQYLPYTFVGGQLSLLDKNGKPITSENSNGWVLKGYSTGRIVMHERRDNKELIYAKKKG